jgi:LPS sulfotransferase NodH
MEPGLSYLICATPRSGSTLLCEALTNTGIAGRPEEHFQMLEKTGRPRQPSDYFSRSNDPEIWALLDDPEFESVLGDDESRYTRQPTWPEIWGVSDFEGFLDKALQEGTTPNGVFGTKIMWAYFRDFVRLARRMPGHAGVSPYEVPEAVFPNLRRYVWISRNDTVRQAVSLWKALQTWTWRESAPEDDGEVDLRFNFAAVDHLRLRINEHNAAWQAYFEQCGIHPLKVVYEDFVGNYEDEVLRLLNGLGIRLPEGFAIKAPEMRRQADETSEEWVRLYHEHRMASKPLRTT